MAAPSTVKIGPWGRHGAHNFDVGHSVCHITKVKLYTGEIVDGLEISYVDDQNHAKTYEAGSRGGGAHEFGLRSGEYINSVTGYFNNYHGEICITKLGFNTNLGKQHGPFGQVSGEKFTVTVHGGQIVGFFGQYHRYISSIGFYLSSRANTVTVSFE